MATDGEAPVCGFDGNPDLIGLGVRSAFYIQTVSFAIAGEFLNAEAAFLHSSAIGLLLAVFVALLRETIRGTLLAPEVAVVMWLFSLQLFASTRTAGKSVPDGCKKVSAANLLTLRLHYLLVSAFIGYSTWYWFVGLDALPRTACTEWAFLFTKVDVRGPFRMGSKVVIGAMCAVCGLFLLFCLYCWSFAFVEWIAKRLDPQTHSQRKAAAERERAEQAKQYNDLVAFFYPQNRRNLPTTIQHLSPPKRVFITTTLLLKAALRGSFFLGLMVCSVELQLRWNEVRGIQSLDSVSQLVPFIMALGQFVHVAYTTIRGKDAVDYYKWFRDPNDPRLFKQIKQVASRRCPKTHIEGGQLEALTAPESQTHFPERTSMESSETGSEVHRLYGQPGSGNTRDPTPMSDAYYAQIGA